MFSIVLGCEKGERMVYREAVRAILIEDDRILLVYSNLGDYKFPGGGIEEGETHAEAIVREIAEETGYVNGLIGEKAGTIVERNEDLYEEGAIFEMTSHYYFCEVPGELAPQRLDDYESEQEFTPVWVTLEEAIMQNEEAFEINSANGWIHRENTVLKELRKNQ
ncbi:NUDIX hydrolase [Alkalihalobacillus sp. CinArs1]|uniref:NUDIX hydrolase n=1 Tax=Alkalihalobacillus sp. CinArs1 TaxID=2995314 RepID=UPI0022DCEA39|nr:NUDIX domain-containing protein [Alkalihalobacillus sp. CinArs1]